jgi:PHD/YefM family antitoxin component YafN of YafNO toxin-antitoxin module
MTKVVSAVEARVQFGQLLRRVKNNNERFVIDRRGEPQAIIMNLDDYIDAVAPEPDWLRKIGDASKRRGTDKLTMREINVEIAAVRRQATKRAR